MGSRMALATCASLFLSWWDREKKKGFKGFCMQLEQNINLISSSLARCLVSGAAGKEYSCAVYFLTDLISIIIDVETWNDYNDSHSPGRDRLCQVYKISLGIKLLGSLQASLNCLKGVVCMFLQLKPTGKLLARQRTNITPLYHLHSF